MRKVTKPKTDQIPTTTGGRIAFVRSKANESQDDLATAFNVSRNYITMIETDKRPPNTDMVITIAKRYGVTSDFLLCLSGIPCGTPDDIEIEARLGLLGESIRMLEWITAERKNDIDKKSRVWLQEMKESIEEIYDILSEQEESENSEKYVMDTADQIYYHYKQLVNQDMENNYNCNMALIGINALLTSDNGKHALLCLGRLFTSETDTTTKDIVFARLIDLLSKIRHSNEEEYKNGK